LQTNPCKHPVIILKDTARDEASAMLEFAYTGKNNDDVIRRLREAV